jgi:glycosyltransferase involved in cell wall biosynthesis
MPCIETSIIIPTYNREKLLYKCLNALNNQTYPVNKYEIIIVNDGSTDGTEKKVKQLNLKPGLIYHYQEQTGPARARNWGIKHSNGEFIIFIDDDIIVRPEFIYEHIKIQKKHKKVIVHGPVIYTNNLENPTSEEMKITDYSRAFFATGNVSIRKKYLSQTGLFNESFKEYGWEDLELGYRLQAMKLKAIKAAEAKGFHLKHRFSPEKLPTILEKERTRGRTAIIFCKINSSLPVKLATLNLLPFFWLEKLLTLGNWTEWQVTYNLVKYLHQKGWTMPVNFITGFMKLHAYFNGMKQGPDQLS